MSTEINEIENGHNKHEQNQTWFFENTDKVDDPLAKLINIKWGKVHMKTLVETRSHASCGPLSPECYVQKK